MPVAARSGFILEKAGHARQAVRQALVTDMVEILRRNNGSFLLFPYLTKQSAYHDSWGNETFAAVLPPGTYLPIRWTSFEAYLAGRKTSVRKDYRLHVNRAGRQGLLTRVGPRLPDHAMALRLIRNVEKRHRAAPNPYLESMINAAPLVDGKWLIVELDGKMVGCGLILQDGGEMILTLLGLDLGVQQVYFSLMYGAIRYAIENGLSGLHGGGGAYYFKSRLGYRLVENNYIRVYAPDGGMRRLGRYLAEKEAYRTGGGREADGLAWTGFKGRI